MFTEAFCNICFSTFALEEISNGIIHSDSIAHTIASYAEAMDAQGFNNAHPPRIGDILHYRSINQNNLSSITQTLIQRGVLPFANS
jgi:hypothetical protein